MYDLAVFLRSFFNKRNRNIRSRAHDRTLLRVARPHTHFFLYCIIRTAKNVSLPKWKTLTFAATAVASCVKAKVLFLQFSPVSSNHHPDSGFFLANSNAFLTLALSTKCSVCLAAGKWKGSNVEGYSVRKSACCDIWWTNRNITVEKRKSVALLHLSMGKVVWLWWLRYNMACANCMIQLSVLLFFLFWKQHHHQWQL